MPLEDIDKRHAHLSTKESLKPKPRKRGIVSKILSFLGQKSIDGNWEPRAPKSANWQSERGSFDPELPYSPGKPQKKGKPVANPPENKHPSQLDESLSLSLLKQFPNTTPLDRAQVPAFMIESQDLIEVLSWLKCKAPRPFSLPLHMSAIDWPDKQQIELVYELRSSCSNARVSIHALVPRENPHIISSASVFECFNWHEREAAELFGVVFDSHPDPRKLLLDSTYTGFPLRKEYEDPEHEFIKKPY